MNAIKTIFASLAAVGLLAAPGMAQVGDKVEAETGVGIVSDPLAQPQDQAGLAFQNQVEARNYPRGEAPYFRPHPQYTPGVGVRYYNVPQPVFRQGTLWSGPWGRTYYRPTYTFPYPEGTYYPAPNPNVRQFMR